MTAAPRARFPLSFVATPIVERLVDLVVICLLLVGAHHVYRNSTGFIQLCDSTYSLVVAEKLLLDGTFDLSGTVPADPERRRAMQGYLASHDLPYQLGRFPDARDPANIRIFYLPPLGSSVLSLPWIKVAIDRGRSVLDDNGVPDPQKEGLKQLKIAAVVCAVVVALFYVLSRFFCPVLVSAAIAVAYALGSALWSTLSRALWSHTFMVFWLAVAVLLIVSVRFTRPRPSMDVALGAGIGTALFWIYFTRPHGVLSAVAIGMYLLIYHRRVLAITLVVGAIWCAALVAASFHYFGTALPPSVYSAGLLDANAGFRRLYGILFSPSRGFLVYGPYLVPVVALLFVCRRHIPAPHLLVPAGSALLFYCVLYANYSEWHAGASYGSRYFADLLPWYVLATAMAVAALQSSWRERPRGPKAALAAALPVTFGWGIFVHSHGANSVPAWLWNFAYAAGDPVIVVMDWKHPQFLAGITFATKEDGRFVDLR